LPGWSIALIIILVVLLGATIGLYFYGKKLEKRQAEQKEQIDAAAQQISMLVIDKKKMKMTQAGLPQMVIDQTPWYLRRSKLPIVKAKVGPKVMTFIAEESVFGMIPTKKEVKATVSGLYITGVKGIHGAIEKPQGKKKLIDRLREKAAGMQSTPQPTGKKKK